MSWVQHYYGQTTMCSQEKHADESQKSGYVALPHPRQGPLFVLASWGKITHGTWRSSPTMTMVTWDESHPVPVGERQHGVDNITSVRRSALLPLLLIWVLCSFLLRVLVFCMLGVNFKPIPKTCLHNCMHNWLVVVLGDQVPHDSDP